VLEQAGLIMAGYLALGRPGAVIACLAVGLPIWEIVGIVLLIDLLQIPVYGLLMEAASRHVRMPARVRSWMERRREEVNKAMTEGRIISRLSPFKAMGVVAVSGLPIKGFGVFSACLLAFLLGYKRFRATALILLGSFLGTVVLILILFYPLRWARGL
jgi:uncharacterized membrane protein